MKTNCSKRFSLCAQFLGCVPACFDECLCNRVSVAWIGGKSVLGINEDLRIFCYLTGEIDTSSHLCTALHNERAEFWRKVPKLDALTNQLNFLQFSHKARSLHHCLFMRDARRNVQAANRSLRHFNKSERSGSGTPFCNAFRAIRYPNSDSDRSNGPYGLNPRSRICGRQDLQHLCHSEADVKYTEDCKCGYAAENGPVEKLEIFGHGGMRESSSRLIVRQPGLREDLR